MSEKQETWKLGILALVLLLIVIWCYRHPIEKEVTHDNGCKVEGK